MIFCLQVEVENNNSFEVALWSIFTNAIYQTCQIFLISPEDTCCTIPPFKKLRCTFKIDAK